jgi:uncharacterized membrane protein YvbJ
MKKCPKCGKLSPHYMTKCPKDGTELVDTNKPQKKSGEPDGGDKKTDDGKK